ncbi:MAG: triose-phosphate isomerase [Rhodanobacteraceae bacterium]
MAERRPLVAGNWKMHGAQDMAGTLLAEIAAGRPSQVEVAVFPPFPYLTPLAASDAGKEIVIGAQDVSQHPDSGAYTGEVSAAMLADVGCGMVLVGHSERRQYHAESNQLVAAKFVAARAAGLTPVLCLGESLAQREAGDTEKIVAGQLAAVLEKAGTDGLSGAVLAYEPVWAIGTGMTASPEQVDAVHAFLRSQLAERDVKLAGMTRIVYGGSVKPANAADLFALENVDGGLIGGASLKASDFLTICRAACN